MLLTITTTHRPATDLGYLLHKHPAKVQTFTLNFGAAHVFYPEASTDRCTAALLVDVDPIKLSRRPRRSGGSGFGLQPYVNDRPYVASSFLSVAIAKVFGSALNRQCKDRPELVDMTLPLRAKLVVMPCHSGEALLRALFEPLGYVVTAQGHVLDKQFPEWGNSPYFTVELRNRMRVCDLLAHLYVLAPVLDDDKHYWVGDDEVEKLLQRGGEWLARHPEREQIVRRYLKRNRGLTRTALAQLAEEDDLDPDTVDEQHNREEAVIETAIGLHRQRLEAVLALLKESRATRVLDLGCGEGKLLELLLQDAQFTEIVGLDVSHRCVQKAANRLNLDNLPNRQRERIQLIHGSLTYRDGRLSGYDAAAVVEVVEHLEPHRLRAFERVLFEFARPSLVIITTPNREYNVKWPNLAAGLFRHQDHRFEWTRAEFRAWASRVAATYAYATRFESIGPVDADVGSPTQMGVFSR